jgi:hypothetical protein
MEDGRSDLTNLAGPGLSEDLKETDVAILVVSCDAYKDLWTPFFLCFFKYWPDCPYPVYLGSNVSEYPDSKVRPILVGADIDYSSNLITMLGQIRERWVILWIEDRVLSEPVNTTRLVNLIRLAQTQQAGFLKLIGDHPLAFLKDSNKEFGEIPIEARYRVCMTIGLWDKQVLLRLLRPGETAWDLERQGSRRSVALGEKFFTLNAKRRNNPPISYKHLIIKGRLFRDARPFLEKENLHHLIQRPLESIRTYWYVKVYLATMDIFSTLKWQWQRWFS